MEILLYNLDRLNINFKNLWSFASQESNAKTIEERRRIVENEKQQIIEKKEEKLKEIFRKRDTNYFSMLRRGFLHIIYIIIYVQVFRSQVPQKEVNNFFFK